MLRLEMLGGLSLRADAEPRRTTQRRRIALLALLAAAGERGLSRDKLQAYLWPESPAENARHALEQLLYALRRQFGDDVVLGTNPVALNPKVIESDTDDFQRAFEQGALEEAVALYRGPFLDGFFLSDAPEFERWADAERGRLAQSCMRALESLARRDAERAPAAALEWWRRLVAMDPYATGPTLGLMGELAICGDPAGALKVARVHQTLIREDLDAEPDPRVSTLAEQLRAGRGIDSAATPIPGALSHPVASSTDVDPAPAALPIAPARAAVPSTGHSGWAVLFAVGGAMLIGLAVAASWAVAHGRLDDRPVIGVGDPAALVVAPFGMSASGSALAYVRDGLVDLASAKFTGEGGLVALDGPTASKAWREVARGADGSADVEAARRVARRLGASLILTGNAVREGESELVLNGTLLDVRDGRVRARATVRGPIDSVSVLVDRLAVELLALHAGEGEQRVASLATVPLPAVRAYLDGRIAYRHGQYQTAVARYERALELDSTFALAALELASTTELRVKFRSIAQAVVARVGWSTERDTVWSRGVEVAWRERDHLPSDDRRYLEALRGSAYPNPTSALDQLHEWEREVEEDPDRADAWYRFGALLLAQGAAVDVPDASERARLAFERAVALDSDFVAPLGGLVEVAAFARDTAAVRRLGALYVAHDSTGDDADYIRWRVATLVGDDTGLRRLRNRFGSIATQSLVRIQWTSQMDGIALEDAERAVKVLMHRAGDRVERTRAIAQARWLALNRGRPQAALGLDDSLVSLEGQPYWGLGFRVLYALYWDGDTSAAAAAVPVLEGNRRAMVAARSGAAASAGAASELVRPEQWRLWHGEWSLTPRIVALLRQSAASDSANITPAMQAEMLDAILASETKRPDAGRALERLDSLARQGCCAVPHYASLVVARLRERAGDLPGALRAARRARWVMPPEYLSASLDEEGRIAALMGDREAAVRAYRHFLALQDSAEASRQGEVEQVRAELKRLESPPR
jgi:DNA-binding SARP family transcriptional activator/tetratricopeptide (TPR) repeat protein